MKTIGSLADTFWVVQVTFMDIYELYKCFWRRHYSNSVSSAHYSQTVIFRQEVSGEWIVFVWILPWVCDKIVLNILTRVST